MTQEADKSPEVDPETAENKASAAFKRLDNAIERAFRTHAPEDIAAAIEVIQLPESARLMGQAFDPGHEDPDIGVPLFKGVRDATVDDHLTNKNWQKLANTLEAILTGIRNSWSQEFLEGFVNYIGYTENKGMASHPLKQTIRDMIESDATYKDIPDCQNRFDRLFAEFRLQTREEALRERIRPSRPRTTLPFN